MCASNAGGSLAFIVVVGSKVNRVDAVAALVHRNLLPFLLKMMTAKHSMIDFSEKISTQVLIKRKLRINAMRMMVAKI
jgi:hypothetical protein